MKKPLSASVHSETKYGEEQPLSELFLRCVDRADKCRKLLEEATKSFQPATPASSAKKPAVSGPEPELSEEAAAAKVLPLILSY